MATAQSPEKIFDFLCRARGKVSVEDRFSRVQEWREHFVTLRGNWDAPIDAAIAGGFECDRIGYAFAGGYQSALKRLVPTLGNDEIASICITEEGGGHPKAIESTLRPSGTEDSYLLEGVKKWATMSTVADSLLVAAVRGDGATSAAATADAAATAAGIGVAQSGGKAAHGSAAAARAEATSSGVPAARKSIVMVRVGAHAPGVTLEPMPPTPFAPEIVHGQLRLARVAVAATALLPGDGYSGYIKPFRTIEDAFVTAALAAFMLRIAFAYDWSEPSVGELLQVLAVLRSVALCDPDDAAVHVVLAGALEACARLSAPQGAEWDKVEPAVRDRWTRDVALSSVAGRARAMRWERAWERLQAPPEAPGESPRS